MEHDLEGRFIGLLHYTPTDWDVESWRDSAEICYVCVVKNGVNEKVKYCPEDLLL